MNKILKNLCKYEYFIRQLVIFDLKIKYKGSFIGILWALIEPLSKFFIMFFVFSNIFKNPIVEYPLFLFSGIIIWNFFEGSTIKNVNKIIEYSNMVKKINFPKEILILSGVLSSFISLLIESLFVFFLMIYYGRLSIFTLPLMVFLYVFMFILSLGVSLIISALNVFMRDIQYIWKLILQILFFATPIFYDINNFPEYARAILTLNPLVGFMNFFRETIIAFSNVPVISLSYSMIFSLVIFFIGTKIFNKYKKRFAEEL